MPVRVVARALLEGMVGKMPAVMPAVRRSAIVDESGDFRYLLAREWDASLPRLCWIMLNPSTADHEVDDPTILACVDFSTRLGFGALDVVNLYGFRTSSPAVLRREARRRDVVGVANDGHLLRAAVSAGLVLAAWGRGGAEPVARAAHLGDREKHRRDDLVLRLLARYRVDVHALKVLPGDVPGHPLARGNHRIQRTARPVLFRRSNAPKLDLMTTHRGPDAAPGSSGAAT